MTFLILAITCSTINLLLFKAFPRLRIDLLTAVVANYAACVAIGFGSSSTNRLSSTVFAQGWYPFSILQGGILVTSFFLLGPATQKHGVSVASLATRLSVAIPTTAAFLLYNDVVTASKVIGLFTALIAIYLSSVSPAESTRRKKKNSGLPLVLFVVFGAHFTLVKFVQEPFLGHTAYHEYVMFCFLSAFVISTTVLIWRVLKLN